MAPSGWLSGNAVCCEHRGQNPDKRGRGGFKVSSDTLSWHCFNCSFTASYRVGKPLYPKFVKLMEWLGIDDQTIKHLKFEALKISKEAINVEPINNPYRQIKPVKMPDCNLLQNESSTHQAHINFLLSRGFTTDDFPFLVSSDIGYKNRVILPFILHDTIVGFSARSIIPQDKSRYIMKVTTDYVFGLDWVQPEHKWVFVTEGLFDALSVKSLAVMHNEISDAQTEMICDLQKHIIVVPHLDAAGVSTHEKSLINTALDCGWSVAFPEWTEKDINAAYVKYGALFCVTHLLKSAINDPFTIRLRQKLLTDEFKKQGH
jgi:hypothetical protein